MAAEEGYGIEWPGKTKSYPHRHLLPQFDDEAPQPVPPDTDSMINSITHLEVVTEEPEKPTIDPILPIGK